MVLLLAQLVQRIAQLEYKPPVTLGIVAGVCACCMHLHAALAARQQVLIPAAFNWYQEQLAYAAAALQLKTETSKTLQRCCCLNWPGHLHHCAHTHMHRR
jgi:hypothetical protein